jgi:putative ABC transport system ATP-binding protein
MLAELNEQDRSTILMVTHDPFSASFGNRVLFIRDGKLKKEIDKELRNRNDFYQIILSEISTLGGE